MDYSEFLARKALRVEAVGFDAQPFAVDLFPFQRDIVALACKLGRFCIWADCGMGKTAMQLEWARQVCEHTGGRVLILAPLAVSHQTAFARIAPLLWLRAGTDMRLCTTDGLRHASC